MNKFEIALMEFWNSFVDSTQTPPVKIPAFSGHVERAEFPYITYELKRPAFGTRSVMRVSIWDRRAAAAGFRGLCNHILEQIEARIPEGGLVLNWDEGALWIGRAANFIEYQTHPDPDDARVVRAIVSLEVRGYVV